MDVPSPDEKSVITYVSSIYDAFPKIPEGGEGIVVNVGVILLHSSHHFNSTLIFCTAFFAYHGYGLNC